MNEITKFRASLNKKGEVILQVAAHLRCVSRDAIAHEAWFASDPKTEEGPGFFRGFPAVNPRKTRG